MGAAAFPLASGVGRPPPFPMAEIPTPDALDAEFYHPAESFFQLHRKTALTYDDVTLATRYTEILPREAQMEVRLADGLNLNIPLVSADMDTVTEARMATAMALNGGLGLIHYNMAERDNSKKTCVD